MGISGVERALATARVSQSPMKMATTSVDAAVSQAHVRHSSQIKTCARTASTGSHSVFSSC